MINRWRFSTCCNPFRVWSATCLAGAVGGDGGNEDVSYHVNFSLYQRSSSFHTASEPSAINMSQIGRADKPEPSQ